LAIKSLTLKKKKLIWNLWAYLVLFFQILIKIIVSQSFWVFETHEAVGSGKNIKYKLKSTSLSTAGAKGN
jgi:hypothetical protein